MPFGSSENGVAAVNLVRQMLEGGVLQGRDKETVERVRDAVERIVF